jgi:hypothetical protein
MPRLAIWLAGGLQFEPLLDRKWVEPDPESRHSLLLEAARRMLAAGGAGLVVDDLQWADASSIWIPEAVLPRLVGVGAVLVYRPDELVPGNAASTFVTRARANVTVIEIASPRRKCHLRTVRRR